MVVSLVFLNHNLAVIRAAQNLTLIRQRYATFPTPDAAIEGGFLGAERGSWLLPNGEWDPNEWIGLYVEEYEDTGMLTYDGEMD